ncbi:hypothetical protein FQA39_LY15749 [Lamprigera yunnana]|nr:hypothetical protein FQA39_LY15749 [Lamprigera yunnana]
MEKVKSQCHRPGFFKQSNKQHKHGRHRSKGSINATNRGKVSLKTLSKKNKRELNKTGKRNQANQIRQRKRDEVLAKKRSIGGSNTAPFLICILPLNKQLDPGNVLSFFLKCDEGAIVYQTSTRCTHISVPRFKQRFTFVVPNLNNHLEVLDVLKVCDTVLFAISAAAGFDFAGDVIDESGYSILLSAFAQGMPTPLVVVTEFEGVPEKKRNSQKQNILKLISKWMPNEKFLTLSKTSDALNVLRKIGSQKLKTVTGHHHRPQLYGEKCEYIDDSTGTMGTLKITGYLRGASLSVNDLIHIPGLGDFQMAQISSREEPANILKKGDNLEKNTFIVKVLEKCDPSKQESLESENAPDPLDSEQTWPTQDELKIAEDEKKERKVKKIPKGWSEYQAAWIPDDFAEFVSSDEEDKDPNCMDVIDEREEEDSDREEEFDTMTESELDITDQHYDDQLNVNEEIKELEKIKAAASDLLFPDEIDTPLDVSARIRFQKYRGLESFRTSPWDVKENLPSDYARIFQFENFNRTKKRVFKVQEEKEGVLPGWYITVDIKNVSQLLWSSYKSTSESLVAIGLLPHEHKMSVANVVLKRTNNYDVPIESKERLIFQCGYRRFIVNPIFSQHTNGQKHKYERYFQPNSVSVATFYAPIQFPPASVLCFKEINTQLVLVAQGNLLSCNPDRLIIKRIVLSGHPFQINKHHAVVRFMFFNREDIIYFKPVKLRTKYGRIGHIKEPLGTRGHMKCVFDGQLKSMDTVTLNLYKRIFPKWIYEECIVINKNTTITKT